MDNNIKIYGVLQNYTTDKIIAYAKQVYDEDFEDFLDNINKNIRDFFAAISVSESGAKVNGNLLVTGSIYCDNMDFGNQFDSYITADTITENGTVTNNNIRLVVYDEVASASTNTNSYIKNTIDWYIARVVANAPASFDTLKEIADWILNDTTDASAINSRITTNTQSISTINNRLDLDEINISAVQSLASQVNADNSSIHTQLNGLRQLVENYNPDLSNYYTKSEVSSILTNYYNKAEIDLFMLSNRPNLSNYYNKAEVDSLIQSNTPDFSNYYNKSEIDSLIEGYTPNLSNYYTKSQIDTIVSNNAPDFSNYYNKSEVDSLIEGYTPNLSNYYTKTLVDQLIEDNRPSFADYYNKLEVNQLILSNAPDLSNYYNKILVDTLIQTNKADLSDYYNKSLVDSLFSGYYTKSLVDTLVAGLDPLEPSGDLSISSLNTTGDITVGGELVSDVIWCKNIGLHEGDDDLTAINVNDDTVINGNLQVNGDITVQNTKSIISNHASIDSIDTTRVNASNSIITPSIGYTILSQYGSAERTVNVSDIYNFFTSGINNYYTKSEADSQLDNYYTKSLVDGLIQNQSPQNPTGDLSVTSVTTTGDIEVGGELTAPTLWANYIGTDGNSEYDAVQITEDLMIKGDLSVYGEFLPVLNHDSLGNNNNRWNGYFDNIRANYITVSNHIITPVLSYMEQGQYGLIQRSIDVASLYQLVNTDYYTEDEIDHELENYYTKSAVDDIVANIQPSLEGITQLNIYNEQYPAEYSYIKCSIDAYNNKQIWVPELLVDDMVLAEKFRATGDSNLPSIYTTQLYKLGSDDNGISVNTNLIPTSNSERLLGTLDNMWDGFFDTITANEGIFTGDVLFDDNIWVDGIMHSTTTGVDNIQSNGETSIRVYNSLIAAGNNSLSLGTSDNKWTDLHVSVASIYNHLEIDTITSISQGGTVLFRDCDVDIDYKLTVGEEIQTPILYTDAICPNTDQETVIEVRGDMSANSIQTQTVKYMDNGTLVSISLKDIKEAVDYIKSL